MYVYIYRYVPIVGGLRGPSKIYFGPISGQKNWGKKIGIRKRLRLRPKKTNKQKEALFQCWKFIHYKALKNTELAFQSICLFVFLKSVSEVQASFTSLVDRLFEWRVLHRCHGEPWRISLELKWGQHRSAIFVSRK